MRKIWGWVKMPKTKSKKKILTVQLLHTPGREISKHDEGYYTTCAVVELAVLLVYKKIGFAKSKQPSPKLGDNCTCSTIPSPCMEFSLLQGAQ